METQAENKVSSQQTKLKKVLEKINEIAEEADTGDYIYRGEPECYDKVSSNLYREYEKDIEAENFDITVVQEEILKEAREYTTHKMDDPEILTELQHYGGKTNLIDFTTDYLVALFFACNGNPDKPGRVILLGKESEAYNVLKPPRTITRVEAQKSIFVQAQQGFITPDKNKVVCIPADLKGAILEYLRKHHDISTKTIYNDLQGFIKNRSSHKSAYTEFYKGFTYQVRASSTKNPTDKEQWYNKAIVHYTEAIELNPEHFNAHLNRGAAYSEIGDWVRAFQDSNTAIKLNSQNADAYYNRGHNYYYKGEVDAAIRDFSKAIELSPEDPKAYINRSDAYTKKGEVDAAIQDCNKVIELSPENLKAYINRGNAYDNRGDFDLAIQDFNKAIELNPEHANTYYNRGIAYRRKGDFERAIQDFDKAIALDPEDAEAHRLRAKAQYLRTWKKSQ